MTVEWLEKHEYDDASKDFLAQVGEVASCARGEGDVVLAIGARGVEVRIARLLSMQEHCVVASAELLELWPEYAKTGEREAPTVERRVIWAMKYAAGAAMNIPEIPLTTVDRLAEVLGEMLAFFGRKPYALWLLLARRAFIAGETEKLGLYMEKVPPTINRSTHYNEHTDCPGCAVQQLAEFLGPDAKAEDVQALLEPVLEPGRQFPNEPTDEKFILDLMFGTVAACNHAKVRAPALLARALAKSGQWQRATPLVKQASAAAAGCNEEQRIRVWLAELEVARAHGPSERDAITSLWEKLGPALLKLEDPYEILDGTLAGYAALRSLPAGDVAREPLDELACRAKALAKRLDARLARPHHAADTDARLA